jgi:hypothetical protein
MFLFDNDVLPFNPLRLSEFSLSMSLLLSSKIFLDVCCVGLVVLRLDYDIVRSLILVGVPLQDG